MSEPLAFEINEQRLQQEIDELALISENPPPVVTRILFSEADRRGRAFVKKLFSEAGLELRQDAAGNFFARWTGTEPDLPPVATGSHIDAIPNAGKFDGVVGVLGAIEAIRALQQSGFKPRRSIEVIVFTAEEPTRFGIGCVGSRLLSGNLPPERAGRLKDREGKTMEQWLQQVGWNSESLDTVRLHKDCYSAFVELHIEQGPLLDKEMIPIGIVEKIAAPGTLRVELAGVGGHAGAVLMPGRRDALLAGAEIALAVEKAALSTGSPDTVATTGVFQIQPGAVNSVPCQAHLEIDLRDTQVRTRDGALAEIERRVGEICQRRGVTFEAERVSLDPPAICDPKLIAMLDNICAQLKLPAKHMISRAYHDSLFMSQVCPTVMIFIPCREGYSHRPDEFSSPEQIKVGTMVLGRALAMLALA